MGFIAKVLLLPLHQEDGEFLHPLGWADPNEGRAGRAAGYLESVCSITSDNSSPPQFHVAQAVGSIGGRGRGLIWSVL